MRLHYFGHAAVGLEAGDGTSLIVDPYASGGLRGAIDYEPIDWSADYALCTHDHDDHSAVDALRDSPEVVDGELAAGPFQIRRFSYDHDEYGGERFGGSVDAVRIDVDGMSIVHLSDVGQSPAGSIPEPLQGTDLALVPVGGFYTMGAAQAAEWMRRMRPRCVIPIHYATEATDLSLHPLSTFLSYAASRHLPVHEFDRAEIELPSAIPEEANAVVVLRASNSGHAPPAAS